MVSGNIDLLSFTWLGLLVLRVIAARHFAQAIFDKLNGVFVFDDNIFSLINSFRLYLIGAAPGNCQWNIAF